MGTPFRFCVQFAGITLRFLLPTPVQLQEDLSSFLCEDSGKADAEYTVRLLSQPIPLPPKPGCTVGIMELYETPEGQLRVYTPMTEPDGCQVACLLRPNGKNTLYYPARRWGFYSSPLRCFHLIGAERLLLRHSAFLLHSSVVSLNGKMVLFSGPSGAGKSTQAQLWAEHLGAEVINGDRCVIRKQEDIFTGSGSPWSGTSGIYHDQTAPIAGIFLVHQAEENSVQRLGRAAFAPLFSQTLVNSWDPAFMAQITALFADMLSRIPVYRLSCRPDRDAVMTAYHTLF